MIQSNRETEETRDNKTPDQRIEAQSMYLQRPITFWTAIVLSIAWITVGVLSLTRAVSVPAMIESGLTGSVFGLWLYWDLAPSGNHHAVISDDSVYFRQPIGLAVSGLLSVIWLILFVITLVRHIWLPAMIDMGITSGTTGAWLIWALARTETNIALKHEPIDPEKIGRQLRSV